MSSNLVFSWAENAEGRIVHVDNVSRGLQCNCICPHCHEQLLARHGEKNEHGFAHHSNTRGANLEICYMVVLYKLAEQILQTRKKVHVPSYYGIFPEKDIEFVDVKIDSSYEREDKQPDVIATTSDGKQYLIEFTFNYKVQHKQPIDFKNLNCLEIDLSNQSHESVEKFLLECSEDRKWLNNQDYFENIEHRYKNENKIITIKEESECISCEIRSLCSGVKVNKSSFPLVIENNGRKYRICKPELYEKRIKIYRQRKEDERKRKEEWHRETAIQQKQIKYEHKQIEQDFSLQDPSERTCFMCKNNLDYMCRPDGSYARCGSPQIMGVSKDTPPNTAMHCKGFKRK